MNYKFIFIDNYCIINKFFTEVFFIKLIIYNYVIIYLYNLIY